MSESQLADGFAGGVRRGGYGVRLAPSYHDVASEHQGNLHDVGTVRFTVLRSALRLHVTLLLLLSGCAVVASISGAGAVF